MLNTGNRRQSQGLLRGLVRIRQEVVLPALANFETVDAEIKEVDGAHIRVATPAALYRLKNGTVRPQDHLDAAALRERFGLKDEG